MMTTAERLRVWDYHLDGWTPSEIARRLNRTRQQRRRKGLSAPAGSVQTIFVSRWVAVIKGSQA